jgi:D-glycero-alpha-D-manno-heptose-7-phosphate kinase
MAQSVSNARIDSIYETAIGAGATGGKISGAGGGGFMFFYCPGLTRFAVRDALTALGGETKRYDFTSEGLKSWTTE